MPNQDRSSTEVLDPRFTSGSGSVRESEPVGNDLKTRRRTRGEKNGEEGSCQPQKRSRKTEKGREEGEE